MIGQVVGNYKIVRALGEGGVGMVYQGVDTMLDREVAIKVLRPELASQTSVVERFRSEAVTLAKLSHPNIATLYSLFRHGEHLFMVLEFIKGETLDQMLYRRGRIPTDEAIPIFCQSLEGINYAHERGIVHRDIKPGNMMLAEDGLLKVLDFGIARLLGSNRMTRVGNVIGTLEYMSPEQVRGLETDARSDVYGLGIMLYEILTGKLPFESENDFELMKMQTEMLPLPPRALNNDIPSEVEEAIMKAVAKDPNDRFQSAGDFLNYFFELGFALPHSTLGFGTLANFKKPSRPSNPGIKSGEVPKIAPIEPLPQSQIPTEPIISIPKPGMPITLEVGEELKKLAVGETRLGVSQNQEATANEIKGTRLATPTAPNPLEMKATRLGDANTDEVSFGNYEQKPSFFERLTWIHYAGASGVALAFFGVLGLAIVLPIIFSGEPKKVTEQPVKVEQAKPIETPKVETPSTPTPEVVSKPTVESAQPLPNQTQIPIKDDTFITDNPPTQNPNQNPPPTQNQPKQRETVKNNPPPPQQQKKTSPPSAPRQSNPMAANTQSPERDKNNARKVMTGN